ncbi:calcium-binding protein [Shimia thalassica]|uniref:calcium-binding protein n=1 Tax=Shimia thalassica TaxID=1715693 RepID=UPI002736E0E6|nr:calcium-binding protein [Shimia thalassica]
MSQSIFLEDRYEQITLAQIRDFSHFPQWHMLPGGNMAVVTSQETATARTLTYSLYGPDGELVEPPFLMASVSADKGLYDTRFVEGPDGTAYLHFTVVTGTSYHHNHVREAGDNVESTFRVIRLDADGEVLEAQNLITFDRYIPEVQLFAADDGGVSLLYSGQPNPLVGVGGGGYTASTIADPDTLLQRFDASGNPLGDPLVWVNNGVGVVDRDIGYTGSNRDEAFDHIHVIAGTDGGSLVVYVRPWQEERTYNEDFQSISVWSLGADGTHGTEHVVVESAYEVRNTSGSIRAGDLGAWAIAADPAGNYQLLYTLGVVERDPDGSTNYSVAILMQNLDASGAPQGSATEIASIPDAYSSWVALHDLDLREDGSMVFVTSKLGEIDLHTLPDGADTAETVRLLEDAGEVRYGGDVTLREDGGVVVLSTGNVSDDSDNYDDFLRLTTFDADGRMESPPIRIEEARNVEGHLASGPDGLVTVVWTHGGESGTQYISHYLDAQGYRVLEPTVLTADPDTLTLTEAGFVDAGAGADTLDGSDQADRLIGGSGDDVLRGAGGDDMFRPDAGDDTVLGGEGEDTVFWLGRPEDYTAELLDGADVPESMQGQGMVYAITGRNDRLADGRDLIAGVETLHFYDHSMTPYELMIITGRETGAFDELVEGTEDGNDTLSSGIGMDTLRGLGGNDSLSGEEDDDLIEGGAGDDTLVGGQGTDILDGGEGIDTAVFTGDWLDYSFYLVGDYRFDSIVPDLPDSIVRSETDFVVIARDRATGDDQTDFLFGVEELQFADRSATAYDILLDRGAYDQWIYGTSQSEVLIGGIGHDDIVGDAGDDTIYGGPANDTLDGDFGNDSLLGGLGDDSLDGDFGDDTLEGGPGNDSLRAGGSEGTGDVLRGGDGDDYLRGWWGRTQFEGGAGNDYISGGPDEDWALGEDGDDTIQGHEGEDVLDGGAGVDSIRGGNGHDLLFGRDGDDSLYGERGRDTLNGGDGDDLLVGGFDTDDLADLILGGAGHDTIRAASGNDNVFGQDGDDQISGGLGADTLAGQNGDDVITGGGYADQIFGNAGDDFINGGWGYDLVNGGADADRFFHIGIADHGSDWIQDYDAAEGDILQFGIASATRSQFQINTTHTATAAGERSGEDSVEEAFVIYRPTGQIMWALVDGGGQSSINLQVGGDVFDLLG